MNRDNKYELLRHRDRLPFKPEFTDAAYDLSLEERPAPQLLVWLDQSGGKLTYCPEMLWGWEADILVYCRTSKNGFLTMPEALRDWEATYREARPSRKPGRMTNLALVTENLSHHLDHAHRIAAQDSVPSNVTIPPDARVSQVSSADGRVVGVWVDAKVYVNLA